MIKVKGFLTIDLTEKDVARVARMTDDNEDVCTCEQPSDDDTGRCMMCGGVIEPNP